MKFLKLGDILKRYNIQRTTLYRWRTIGDFPVPISPINARPFWRVEDILRWENKNVDQGLDQNE
jgi:predicted DNA-binding transcriptional regulator AlpA